MSDDYSDETATFGDRIAVAREAAGLSLAQLAHSLGVRERTLRGWEEDRAEPRADRLRTLAGLMGVSLTWLLSGTGAGPSAGGGEAAELVAEIRAARADITAASDRLDRLERRLREAIA